MYYLSSETSASARETWNDHHEEWRDTWHEAAPRIRVKVNDKTQISTGGWGQSPYIESDGVVNFNHRTGWISDASPYRNYKHVFMRLMTTGSTGVAEWLKEDRDYESGFTFWQGGTRNWMRDADMKIAIWQVHGGTSPVPIYVQGNFGGNMGIDGFWAGREGGSRNRFQYKFPDQSHDAIHVIKVQFRLGDRGYVRIFHNGKKVFDSGIVSMNYDKSWSDFMNYSAYKNASVEQIIYMDRLYFTEVRNPGQ